LRTCEHALSRGCGTGTGDEYGGGYETAREAHVTGQDHDEDPHPIRPAGDTESSYTDCNACLEISPAHVTTSLLPKGVAARRDDTALTWELHQHRDVRSLFRQGADIGRILLGVAVVIAEVSHGTHDVILGEGAP
jgi:hypothetical protein